MRLPNGSSWWGIAYRQPPRRSPRPPEQAAPHHQELTMRSILPTVDLTPAMRRFFHGL